MFLINAWDCAVLARGRLSSALTLGSTHFFFFHPLLIFKEPAYSLFWSRSHAG